MCRLYLFPALSDNPSTSLASGRKSSFVPNVIYGTRSSLCQAKQNRFDRKKKKKKKKKAKSRVQSSSDSFLLLLPFRPKCVMQKSEKADMEVDPITDLISLFFSPLSLDLYGVCRACTQVPNRQRRLNSTGWDGGTQKKKSWERCRSVFIAEFFQRKKLFRFILDI